MNLPIPPPYACLITKGELTSKNFQTQLPSVLELFRAAVDDGVNLIQIREKNLPGRMLNELASSAAKVTADSKAQIIVNDRVDVAIAAGLGAVHLGQHSMSAAIVRRTFGSTVTVGVSTHSMAEATAAFEWGADYIFFGPIFDTPGKGPPVGVESLTAVCREVAPLPVIALGGIDDTNFHLLANSGIAGIAAIRALHDRRSRKVICNGLTRAGAVG